MENKIVTLSELCQKRFRSNMTTTLISKVGPDHDPVITVEIVLPDGHNYHGSGSNQKLAKQEAAKIALKDLGFE